MTKKPTAQHAAIAQRATEATALIDKLINSGSTPAEIGERAQVSVRTVYRWWKEGHAPHPVLLDALRRYAAERR